jgi:hypothetical protein
MIGAELAGGSVTTTRCPCRTQRAVTVRVHDYIAITTYDPFHPLI